MNVGLGTDLKGNAGIFRGCHFQTPFVSGSWMYFGGKFTHIKEIHIHIKDLSAS